MKPRLLPLVLALTVVVGAAACSDGGKRDDFNAQVSNPQSGSAGAFGTELTIPKGFPVQDVPLPTRGRLASQVSKNRGKNEYYSLTYKIGAREANAIAAEYKKALEDARYKITDPHILTGTDGAFTTFTALGPTWDVLVYSGRNNLRDRPRLSVDVTAHGTTTGSVPTEDDLPVVPSTTTTKPTSSSSTTSTTRAFGA